MANSFLEKSGIFVRIHDGCLGAIMVLAHDLAAAQHSPERVLRTLEQWKRVSLNSPPGLIDFDLTDFTSASPEGQGLISILGQLRTSLEQRSELVSSAELQALAGESGLWFTDIDPAFLLRGLDKLIPFFQSLD